MTKQTIRITAEELQDLKDGYAVEIILNGVHAYIAKADYDTGLKFRGMDIEINYYAPDPEDFQIEINQKPIK